MKPIDIEDLILKAKKPAFDFNGTVDSGLFTPPRDAIVITGTVSEEGDYCRETCAKFGIPEKNIYFYNEKKYDNKKIAKFKAEKIKEFGCDVFFENNPAEVYWLNSFLKGTGTNIVYIHSRNYVIFTYDFNGLSYAYRLKQEGNPVVMAVLEPEDAGFTLKSEGDKEIDRRRRETGDGMIKKFPAKLVFKFLKDFKGDKSDYFIDFDFNYGSKYAEALEKMGYKGLFPRKEAQEMENDRQKGQDIIKKNYKLLQLPEEQEFKKVADALNFIKSNQDKIYVVKPNNPDLTCFVPLSCSEEPDAFQREIENYFDEARQGLESKGFILQEKIEKPVEATPEVLYIDGKPLIYNCCIEYKPYGAGDVGQQTGCAADLNFVLNPECKLVEIGNKDYYPLADKKKINNFVDAGILFDRKDGTPYFTEFCFHRKGYNAFLTEMAILPSVSQFFDGIIGGYNPFLGVGTRKFGASIRIFNTQKDENRFVKPDLEIQADSPNVWFYDAKMKDGKIVTVGQTYDAAVVTGYGDSPEEAIDNCKKNLKDIKIKEMYYRNDLDEKDQWYGLLNRYYWLKDNNLI